ncbi:hypothetical protein IM697_20105 [Streptomyces ferrugineus]|uniref:Uncharacterized protein n=1 Tax=Streptomyces ferrugineus TaxID=1413221 RepID=A0A7M2SVV8_9ACTN|nr:hypothetical protein [Streptomyces ferrugineus]QOV40500.1 hypothetical protein IM697_20105 [Streptomyces ferrugineus]
MKDMVVGIVFGLVLVVAFFAVLWVLGRSGEINRQQCEARADEYKGQATCIVVVK